MPHVSKIVSLSRLLAAPAWVLFWALAAACLGQPPDSSPGETTKGGIFSVGTVETVETALLIEDDHSKSETHPDEARHGGVMVIETDSCGIADPAIDVASSHQAMDLRLVSEIHAGLTRLVENGQSEPSSTWRKVSR